MIRRSLLALAVTGLLAALSPVRAQEPATVFAAASLTDAMKALGEAWKAKGHPLPRLSFAASSALARQMEQGRRRMSSPPPTSPGWTTSSSAS